MANVGENYMKHRREGLFDVINVYVFTFSSEFMMISGPHIVANISITIISTQLNFNSIFLDWLRIPKCNCSYIYFGRNLDDFWNEHSVYLS